MKHSKDLHLLVVVSQYTHETLKDLLVVVSQYTHETLKDLLVVVSQYTHEALKGSNELIFTCNAQRE
jgi:predicted deacetylase